jgi:FlaA1/EpsC-like NDP-sugar epimerase
MIRILMHRLTGRALALVTFETTLIVAAVAIATYVRLGASGWEMLLAEGGIAKALLVAGICQACLYYADLYDLREVRDQRSLFTRLVHALASASFILAVLYFWFPSLVLGRGVFVVATALVFVFVVGWRAAFEWIGRRVGPRERLLLVGTGAGAVTLARELFERRQELGVEIVGFIDPDPARLGSPVINPGVVGTVEDIPSIVRARGVAAWWSVLRTRAASCRWRSSWR